MDGDSEIARSQNQINTSNYIDRLSSKAGFTSESLQSAQTRVQLLKQLPAENFMEILTVGNSKLRGDYQRWKRDFHGEPPRAVVMNGMQESPDLEPPEHSEQEFLKLYQQMQKELTTANLGVWATKLYAGVIFSHMFPDANGRLSRNLFSWITTGELAKEDLATKRGSIVVQFAEFLNRRSIERMLDRETGQRFDYRSSGGLGIARAYQTDERHTVNFDSEQGLTARLKYLAAKRAGILDARTNQIPTGKSSDVAACYGDGSLVAIDDNNEYHQISTQPWSEEEQSRFKNEYQNVRIDWFDEIQKIIDTNGRLLEYALTLGMNIPNPLFMTPLNLTDLLQAVHTNDLPRYTELINDARHGSADRIFETHGSTRDTYFQSLQQILQSDEHLTQLINNPPNLFLQD